MHRSYSSQSQSRMHDFEIYSNMPSTQQKKAFTIKDIPKVYLNYSSNNSSRPKSQNLAISLMNLKMQEVINYESQMNLSPNKNKSIVKLDPKLNRAVSQNNIFQGSTRTGLTLKSAETLPLSTSKLFSPFHTQKALSTQQKSKQNFVQTSNIGLKSNHFQSDQNIHFEEEQNYSEQLSEYESQKKELEENKTLVGLNSLPLKIEQLAKLYESKCQDIMLDVQFSQLLKFVDRIVLECSNGKLNLKEQSLGPISANVVAEILFQTQSNFSTLNLSQNNIRDEGALLISQALLNNPNICVVDVSNNNLNNIGCSYFFELLLHNESIYSLTISSPKSYNRNKMNVQTAKILSNALSINQTLSFLDISHLQLGPAGLMQIVKGLKYNQALVSLNISYNELGPQCGEILATSLMNIKLVELNLSSNSIGSKSIELIGEQIRNGQGVFSISILNLSYNKIGSDGLCEFLGMITHNSKISHLNFEGNNFQDEVSENLSQFFAVNRSVTHFNVRDCSFHHNFISQLSEGLKHNYGIEVLDISNNYIGDEGMVSLASALVKENIHLVELRISRCNIQEKGGIELSKVVLTHPRLSIIDASHNLMNEISGAFILNNIRNNWNLTTFDIDKNYIRYDQHIEIKKIIKRNSEVQKSKEPTNLFTTMNGLLGAGVIKPEDIVKKKTELISKEQENKEIIEVIGEKITYAEEVLEVTEIRLKAQQQQIRHEIDEIVQELKDQDMEQATVIQNLNKSIENQVDGTDLVKRQIEMMKKEIKQKGTDIIQRKNQLKGQVAFAKSILREEEQKAKGEELSYQLFLQNVQQLQARIEALKSGKNPDNLTSRKSQTQENPMEPIPEQKQAPIATVAKPSDKQKQIKPIKKTSNPKKTQTQK